LEFFNGILEFRNGRERAVADLPLAATYVFALIGRGNHQGQHPTWFNEREPIGGPQYSTPAWPAY